MHPMSASYARFMSSLSSFPSSSPPSVTAAPGFRPHASSDNLSISEAGPAIDQRMERRRSTLPGPDRKRRLVNPDVLVGPRRAELVMEAGSSSRAETDSRSIPRLSSSHTELNSNIPGSSYDTAINLSSSPPEPRSQRPPLRPSDPRRSSWSRGGNQYLEYIRPQWQPDSEVTECPICGTAFSFWYRKHHCRKCGRVVCASCSPHRITIPRQYIVHPPDVQRSHVVSALGYQHAANVVDSEGDATLPPATLNPALGGGEEVRLCNPCVPDPNPEPPLGYPAVRAPGDIGSEAGWPRGSCVVQQPSSRHRSYHSLSTPGRQHPYAAIPDSFTGRPGRRTVGSSDYPAFSGFGSAYGSTFQERPLNYGSLPSSRFVAPPLSAPRQSIYYPHAGASSSPPGPSSLSRSRGSRGSHSRHSQQIDECDLCPICDNQLPPLGAHGNEDSREAHIRNCIENHGRPGSGSPISQSPHPVRMLVYTATEKDCIGQDGTEQECTICMEEYEVGQSLVRLECLCKFHKRCIVEWFERKKECPVHKAS